MDAGRLEQAIHVTVSSMSRTAARLSLAGWAILATTMMAVACGDDEPETLATATKPAETTTTPPDGTTTQSPRSTGISGVDDVIAAVASGDVDELAGRAHPQDVICSSLPGNMCTESGAGPQGMVSVLPGAICDDNPVLASNLDTFASRFIEKSGEAAVYAAWHAQPGTDGPSSSVPDGSVRVLWESGASLVISEAGEVRYAWYGCGPASEVVESAPDDREYLIEPPTE